MKGCTLPSPSQNSPIHVQFPHQTKWWCVYHVLYCTFNYQCRGMIIIVFCFIIAISVIICSYSLYAFFCAWPSSVGHLWHLPLFLIFLLWPIGYRHALCLWDVQICPLDPHMDAQASHPRCDPTNSAKPLLAPWTCKPSATHSRNCALQRHPPCFRCLQLPGCLGHLPHKAYSPLPDRVNK